MWKITFLWSEIGSGFGETGAHPHQEFPGVPPGVLDHFNVSKNKTQTAVTNMMNQRMLQKTKILKTSVTFRV